MWWGGPSLAWSCSACFRLVWMGCSLTAAAIAYGVCEALRCVVVTMHTTSLASSFGCWRTAEPAAKVVSTSRRDDQDTQGLLDGSWLTRHLCACACQVSAGDSSLSLLPPWHIYQRTAAYYLFSRCEGGAGCCCVHMLHAYLACLFCLACSLLPLQQVGREGRGAGCSAAVRTCRMLISLRLCFCVTYDCAVQAAA
jgi:hypothetical protein